MSGGPISDAVSQSNANASQPETAGGMVTRSGAQLPPATTVSSSNLPLETSGGVNQQTDPRSTAFGSIGQANCLLPSTSNTMNQQTNSLPMLSGIVDQSNQSIPPTFSGINQHFPALAMSTGALGPKNYANDLHSKIVANHSLQLRADQNLQLDLLALKSPLDKFSPLKHVPIDWINGFERYCNSVCQSYNTDMDRFVINNLFTLFGDDENKRWLIEKIDELEQFSWYQTAALALPFAETQ